MMNDEIEIKLAVDQQVADFLAQQISNFSILRQRRSELENCYYDTPDGYFAQRKMGLRVRKENGDYTLTLKTDGNVTGGLHIRPEYNVPLNDAEPDLSRLAQFDGLELPQDLQPEAIFSTDFERRYWLVECGNGVEIEIALDQGEIKAGGKSEVIREVEFELKSGEVNDLLTFVGGLTFSGGVRLSSLSKAERGYRLAAGTTRVLTDWLNEWREIIDMQQSAAEKTHEKLTALLHYEQRLIEETVVLGVDYFSQDFLRTVERIGAFFNLYNYYAEDSGLLANVAEGKNGQNTADGQLLAELNESNDYLFGQIRELIRRHSESKDNGAVMVKLNELLHSGQYVKRMLNLIKLAGR